MSNLKGTKMLAHQLRGLGEFFEPYADEIDALRAKVESERRLTSELRKTEAIQSATIRELRAQVEALRAKIKDHNDDCQAACGHGDQEAVYCGYRSYFERLGKRCPDCPMHHVIEIDEAVSAAEGQKP